MTTEPTTETHYRMANGRWRARAGKGKTPWGLTKTQLERIAESRAFFAIPENDFRCRMRRLYQHVMDRLQDAFDRANAGNKDSARRTLFYLENIGLLQILVHDYHASLTELECAELRRQFKRLFSQCHPQEPSNLLPDIKFIRTELEKLSEFITGENRFERSLAVVDCHQPPEAA